LRHAFLQLRLELVKCMQQTNIHGSSDLCHYCVTGCDLPVPGQWSYVERFIERWKRGRIVSRKLYVPVPIVSDERGECVQYSCGVVTLLYDAKHGRECSPRV